MTAEVAIANKHAVALAADSAVSIGPSADKIYSSALKIFQLVEGAPVGIMVSGAAEFLGIPWETIIKIYRGKKERHRFPNVVNYRDDFLDFISNNDSLFSSDRQIRYVEILITSYFRYIFQLIEAEADRIVSRVEQVTENEVPDLVQDVVSKERARVTQADRLNGFNEEVVRTIRRSFVRRINRIKEEVFPDRLSERTSQMITDLAIDVLTRNVLGPMSSGLVFAGFGDSDIFPSLYSVNVEIMVNSRVRFHAEKEYVVDDDQTAAILPFAQADMVYSFIQGIHPTIDRNRTITVAEILETFVGRIAAITEEHDALLGASLRVSFTECVQSILSEINSVWQRQTEGYMKPLVNNVAALPKDELGAMAESLVNLTKFRLRVSPERETVSGPIDVALISKGDGFVWLKRKHYFQAELNPRVISEYSRRD
ncbi:MAG: hypothetical protein OXH84_00190 [Gammaproteobacteria bacterium]|nr:hypothetical protein [Gammaproteobacteria bacterium]